MIITTTQQIEGYDIVDYLGLVGMELPNDIKEIQKGISEAADKINVNGVWANAVVGLHIQPLLDISGGGSIGVETNCFECYAYGTAVRVMSKEEKAELKRQEQFAPKYVPQWSVPSDKQDSPRIVKSWEINDEVSD